MRVRATWYKHFFANRNIFLMCIIIQVVVTACEKPEVKKSITGPQQSNNIILDAVVPNITYSNNGRVSLDATSTLYRNQQRPIYFSWSCTSFPVGSIPHIQQPKEAKTVADSLVTGKYVFVLYINDELGNNQSASFEVEVLKDTLKAEPPIIYPLPDVTIYMPVNSVSLLTNRSYYVNPPGRILFFRWTVIQQPPGSDPPTITNSTNSIVNLSRLWSGDYLVQLQVTNELGLSSKDTVQLKVIPDSLSGITRIYDNLTWGFVDDEWGQFLLLNIESPNTFKDRNPDNMEVRVWDQSMQAWSRPNEMIWQAYDNGLLIYNVYHPFDPLTGTKTKVQVKFF